MFSDLETRALPLSLRNVVTALGEHPLRLWPLGIRFGRVDVYGGVELLKSRRKLDIKVDGDPPIGTRVIVFPQGGKPQR